jgi:hypothetical protein
MSGAFEEWRRESRWATRFAALGIATTFGLWLLEAPWWAVAYMSRYSFFRSDDGPTRGGSRFRSPLN